ncbi:PilT protein domain-containing protein [Thermincola ferriacetica]|uniref:PilT protein domain-containing protein n=1 Tax=Thermincola ferriacetica TaxID=281456 RepID=A0A0L6W4P0_9FIRM|nr:putative toxin-antitoxin system toxin component, PIN family [Thermincola ferriacetica]KNZ70421.1 PilT protein domain-containing protein [Thermincola ferriacetica]
MVSKGMRNKPRVVIDTNIFVKSWFDGDEVCNEILSLVDNNKIKLLFSQETIGELFYIVKKFSVKNMSSKRPRLRLLFLLSEVFYEADSVNTIDTECPKLNDKYDEMFLKCALEGNADYLITDDFKSGLHSVEGFRVKIVSSEDFMKIYKKIKCSVKDL